MPGQVEQLINRTESRVHIKIFTNKVSDSPKLAPCMLNCIGTRVLMWQCDVETHKSTYISMYTIMCTLVFLKKSKPKNENPDHLQKSSLHL